MNSSFDLKRLVAANYPRIAADLLEPLLRMLELSRRYCSGDVDAFLVILLVAVRTSRDPAFRSLTPAELTSGNVPVFPGLGTNVASIAASLNIPKETVRRKVHELLEHGWLARRGRRLYFTDKAYQALAPVREEIEYLAVRCFQVVSGLERADQAASAGSAIASPA